MAWSLFQNRPHGIQCMSSSSLPIPEFVKKKFPLVAGTDTHALPLTLHHQIGNSMHQKTPCVAERYGTNNKQGQLPTEDVLT